MTPRIFAALLLVWLAPLSVCAQQLPSTLRAEDQLRVLRSDGTTVKGSFLRTSGTVLELRANGVPLEIAEGAIQQIARRRPEPKWDGFLIGLAGGAATGFLVSRADCGSDSECKF